jgi:tetratricopeptide (TPR) repeat protein
MKRFTTSEVGKLLSLPESRIRSFVRAGFLSPGRSRKKRLQFTFQDVLFLKTAKGLLDSRVPPKRITRMLSSLKRQLPQHRHLASIKIYADGHRVIAWDGNARWQPDSGQFLFNFDARSVMPTAQLPRSRLTAQDEKLTAEHWFNVGLELEKASVKEAQRAYHMALEAEPEMAEAHLNLGRLYHETRELEKAEAHYRAALRSAPADAAPAFNLGVLLEDLEQRQKAVEAYRQAIQLDASFADAHYNLGLLLEALGKKSEAFFHLRTARKLYVGR